MRDHTVLWHRLDRTGHEWARLPLRHPCRQLTGTALFVHERRPCRLDYLVVCDSAWQTLDGGVTCGIGDAVTEIRFSADARRLWRFYGIEVPAVAGCIDIDFGFSPSTNVLAIRRLDLAVGHKAQARAAWLKFPELTVEPLDRIYHRIGART